VCVDTGIGWAEVAAMCLDGRIKVRWFRFRDLQQFSLSFNFSAPNWVSFYRKRGEHEKLRDFMRRQWLIADQRGVLVESSGEMVSPHSLSAQHRERLALERLHWLNSSSSAEAYSTFPEIGAPPHNCATPQSDDDFFHFRQSADGGAEADDPVVLTSAEGTFPVPTNQSSGAMPIVSTSEALPDCEMMASISPCAARVNHCGTEEGERYASAEAPVENSTVATDDDSTGAALVVTAIEDSHGEMVHPTNICEGSVAEASLHGGAGTACTAANSCESTEGSDAKLSSAPSNDFLQLCTKRSLLSAAVPFADFPELSVSSWLDDRFCALSDFPISSLQNSVSTPNPPTGWIQQVVGGLGRAYSGALHLVYSPAAPIMQETSCISAELMDFGARVLCAGYLLACWSHYRSLSGSDSQNNILYAVMRRCLLITAVDSGSASQSDVSSNVGGLLSGLVDAYAPVLVSGQHRDLSAFVPSAVSSTLQLGAVTPYFLEYPFRFCEFVPSIFCDSIDVQGASELLQHVCGRRDAGISLDRFEPSSQPFYSAFAKAVYRRRLLAESDRESASETEDDLDHGEVSSYLYNLRLRIRSELARARADRISGAEHCSQLVWGPCHPLLPPPAAIELKGSANKMSHEICVGLPLRQSSNDLPIFIPPLLDAPSYPIPLTSLAESVLSLRARSRRSVSSSEAQSFCVCLGLSYYSWPRLALERFTVPSSGISDVSASFFFPVWRSPLFHRIFVSSSYESTAKSSLRPIVYNGLGSYLFASNALAAMRLHALDEAPVVLSSGAVGDSATTAPVSAVSHILPSFPRTVRALQHFLSASPSIVSSTCEKSMCAEVESDASRMYHDLFEL
jgi:hypothetical protein